MFINHLTKHDWLEASLLLIWSFDHAAAPPIALQQSLLVGKGDDASPDVGPGLVSSSEHRNDVWPIAYATVSPNSTTASQNLPATNVSESSSPDADSGLMGAGHNQSFPAGSCAASTSLCTPSPHTPEIALDPPHLMNSHSFDRRTHWACKKCTLVNECKRKKCLACRAVDPARPIKRIRAL